MGNENQREISLMDIRLEVLTKNLISPFLGYEFSVDRVFHATPSFIKYIVNNKSSLVFEVHIPFYSLKKNMKLNRWHCSELPDIAVGHTQLSPYFISGYKNHEITHGNVIISSGINGVFQYKIPPSLVDTFFKSQLSSIMTSDFFYASEFYLKIEQENGKLTDSLARFRLVEKIEYDEDMRYYTNYEKPKYYSSKKIITELNIFSHNNFVNSLSPLIKLYEFRSLVEKLNTQKAIKQFKPYFLVKFIRSHRKFVEIDDKSKKKLDQHNISRHCYEGVIAQVEHDTNPKQSRFLSLIPFSEVQKVKLNGEFFIPINIKTKKYKDIGFQSSKYPNYTLLKPIDEGLSIVIMVYNPFEKKWIRHLLPLPDHTSQVIAFDKQKKSWVSSEIDRWDHIKPSNGVFNSVMKNFSVECSYRRHVTLAQCRGLDRHKKSKNLMKTCFPVMNFIPSAKLKEKIWFSDKIAIQQSTFGIQSDKVARIIKFDPKTKTILRFYDDQIGSPVLVDGDDFRKGKIGILFGENTTRIDIAPVINKKTIHSSAHVVMAKGFYGNSTMNY